MKKLLFICFILLCSGCAHDTLNLSIKSYYQGCLDSARTDIEVIGCKARTQSFIRKIYKHEEF